jgi:parallel beta-helix repeat protein
MSSRLVRLIPCLLAGVAAVMLTLAGLAATASSTTFAERLVCPTGCTYSTIQAAVDAAGPGDVIKVAAGTYADVTGRMSTGGLVTQVVFIEKTITLRGGYDSTFSEPPDPVAHPTIVNPARKGRGFYIRGAVAPVIEGFTVTAGDAAGMPDVVGGEGGGCLYSKDASPTLRRLQVSGCYAKEGAGLGLYYSTSALEDSQVNGNQATTTDGAGLYAFGGSLNVKGCQLTGNSAARWGGGARISGGTLHVTNTVVSQNTAKEGAGLDLYLLDRSSLVANSRIYQNTATGDGGGINLSSSDPTLTNNIVATNTGRYGGGLYILMSDARLIDNTIRANHAMTDGGAMRISSSEAQLLNTQVISNTAGRYAGGIDISGGSTFTNTLIADNSAPNHSGINIFTMSSSERVRLTHSTIARNGSHGIYYGALGGTLQLTNTILVGHQIGIYAGLGTTVRMNATLWGSGAWANGTDKTGSGTLTSLGDVVGLPNFADYLRGNYHLAFASAAIDRGVMTPATRDIDYDLRPVGAAPDLGMDEALLPPPNKTFVPLIRR